MSVGRPPLLHRVSLSGGTLPAPFHSHTDNGVSAANIVPVSTESGSRPTVSHHAPLASNGTETLTTSQSKQHADSSTSQPNGSVTLAVSQPSNSDVALSNGAITLAESVAIAPSVSTAVFRQQQ